MATVPPGGPGPSPQPRVFTIFHVMALVPAGLVVVALVRDGWQVGGWPWAVAGAIGGLILLPILAVGGFYAVVFGIVGLLWVFSVDRDWVDQTGRTDVLYPPHWWDVRPALVVGLVVATWWAWSRPALLGLPQIPARGWPVPVILNVALPLLGIALALRRWLLPLTRQVGSPALGPDPPRTRADADADATDRP